MAIFRSLHTYFWKDRFFSDLTPEDKYFYIYLLTNDRCTQCGIYDFVSKFAAVELGYSIETVDTLLERFVDYGKILYNAENGEVMILNWYKYNLNMNNRNSRVCINTCLKGVKTFSFIERFHNLCREQYPNNIEFINEMFEGIKFERGTALSDNYDDMDKADYWNVTEEESLENEDAGYSYENKEDIDLEKAPKEGLHCDVSKSESFEEVKRVFEVNFHSLTPIEAVKLTGLCQSTSFGVVIKGIEVAVLNNKKSFAYLNGILKNWVSKGVKSVEDLEKVIEASKKQKTNGGMNGAYRLLPTERYDDEEDF